MKEKIVNVIVNLFKVKSIVTFATIGVLIYCVINNKLDDATITAIIIMVFESLFGKDKKGE